MSKYMESKFPSYYTGSKLDPSK